MTKGTQAPPREREQLGRGIRLRSLFSLAFGTIIGVGWIIVMGAWLSDAGAIGAIVAFAAGGLAMLAIGLCYAEMRRTPSREARSRTCSRRGARAGASSPPGSRT